MKLAPRIVAPLGLARSMAKSSLWSVSQRWAMRLIGLVSALITARLLTPEDFGVMAMALIVVSTLDALTSFGIEASLIRDHEATPDHYNTAWTMTVLRGLLLAAIVAVGSVPLAAHFNAPELVPVYFAIAAYVSVSGFRNIGVVDFRKHLRFDKEFHMALVKRVVGFGTVVLAALLLRNYWAFVISTTAIILTDIGLSYLMSSYRPRFSLKTWRSLFDFSKWMFIGDAFNAVGLRLELFIVSSFSPKPVVGAYSLASDVSAMPSTDLAMPLSASLMPGLSRITGDRAEIRRLSTGFLGVTLMLAMPMGIGMAVIADDLVMVALGEKWLLAVPFVQALSVGYLLRTVGANRVAVLMAMGHIRLLALQSGYLLAVRLTAMLTGAYLFGAVGIAWGVVAAAVINGVMIFVWQSRAHYMYFCDLWRQIWRTSTAVAVMAIAVGAFAIYGAELPAWQSLLCKVTIGAASYSATLLCLWQFGGRPIGPESYVMRFICPFGDRAASGV